jgi:uncharacterized membrane protein
MSVLLVSVAAVLYFTFPLLFGVARRMKPLIKAREAERASERASERELGVFGCGAAARKGCCAAAYNPCSQIYECTHAPLFAAAQH